MKVRHEHCGENDVWEKTYIKYGKNHMLNVPAKRRTSVADFTGSAMKLDTRGPSKATRTCLSTSTQSSPLWRTRTPKNTTKHNKMVGREKSWVQSQHFKVPFALVPKVAVNQSAYASVVCEDWEQDIAPFTSAQCVRESWRYRWKTAELKFIAHPPHKSFSVSSVHQACDNLRNVKARISAFVGNFDSFVLS